MLLQKSGRGALFLRGGRGAVVLLAVAVLQAGSASSVVAQDPPGAESAVADTTATDTTNRAPVLTLPPLLVIEKTVDPLTGSTSLNSEAILSIPQSNPNITDLVPLLPGVQATDDANISHMGGEILPDLFSISGGKANQNNFVVDGVSSSNQIDPFASNPEDPENVPGHPSGMFPNARLVEEITVLDHNIPARYSGFTGGAVDVRMRDPRPEYGAGINFRTTRSNWTWFHLSQDKRDYLENERTTITVYPQFKFMKYDGGVHVDIPTGDDSAFLGAYQRTQSDLIYPYLGGEKSQQRVLENYLAKWTLNLGQRSKVGFSFVATPYEARHFLEETKDSDYTIRNRTLSGKADFATSINGNDLEFLLAYSSMQLTRNAPRDFWQWANTPSKNWGTGQLAHLSLEGGYGSLERNQDTVSLQTHQKYSPQNFGWLNQIVESGFEVGWTDVRSARPETTYSYGQATIEIPDRKDGVANPPADCGGDPDCIDGEQYFRFKKIYDRYRIETERTDVGAYLQDLLVAGPFTLRPGLRFDYDTYSENNNFAPRMSSSLDLFGTVLFFGLNRYYGNIAFTDALREKEPPAKTQKRNSFELPWIETISKTSSQRKDLKTPYTDEISAGISQPLPRGKVGFDYVHRKGMDEIAREIDVVKSGTTTYSITHFNNNGRSHYESYRLVWDGRWKKTGVMANVTYEETNTSVEKYDDLLDDKTLNRKVYYNGKFLDRDELPRADYNRNWLGNLILTQQLPLGFEFSNVTRYRGPYSSVKLVKLNKVISGQTVDEYAEVKTPAGWAFDWKLAWRQPIAMAEIMLSVEVLNVFNHSNRVGGEEGYYEQGRQIWAGMEGRF